MNINELHDFSLDDAVKFNTRLNPVLFHDEHLIPKIRKQLLTIADDFMQHMGVTELQVKDILLVGSNAAYTYTPHSDIDLHLVVDLGKNRDNPVYKELFTSKKAIYNDQHEIKIKNYDVELYIQDIKDSQQTLGEYSILKNKWIKFPSKRKANFDERATRQKFNKIVQLAELALRSGDLEKLDAVLDTIKKYRKAGLTIHGEFGPENLAYKALRSQGIIQQLFDYRGKLHGQELSMDEDYDPNEPPPGPEFKPTMPAGTVRVDVSDVYDWYKLGQNISNLDRIQNVNFGAGPPSTIMAFGSEDEEHKYIKALLKTGLTTTDIDPPGGSRLKGQKVDRTYNVDTPVDESETQDVAEEINPDVRNYDFKDKQNIGDYVYTAEGSPIGLTIKCYDKKELIGRASFMMYKDHLESMDTKVSSKYQGKGIATTMYAYAKMLGNDIKPSPVLTTSGKKMWAAWKKSGAAKHLTSEQEISEDTLEEKWSKEYKRSINCSSPKGFSQRAHCAARKARQAGRKTSSKSVSEDLNTMDNQASLPASYVERNKKLAFLYKVFGAEHLSRYARMFRKGHLKTRLRAEDLKYNNPHNITNRDYQQALRLLDQMTDEHGNIKPYETDDYVEKFGKSDLKEKINPELTKSDFHTEKEIDIPTVGKLKLVLKNLKTERPEQFIVDVITPDDKNIGYFRFVIHDYEPQKKFRFFSKKKDPYVVAGNISVWNEYQKKGIATAVYSWVKSLGNDIKPSSIQTDAGKAMWRGFNKNSGSIVDESINTKAEEYRAHLLKTLPIIMNFLNKAAKDPKPTEQDMLDAIEAGYQYLLANPDGTVKDAGAVLRKHLSAKGLAEGELSEGFDQPYPLKWEKSEHGDYDAMTYLPDGTVLSIMFNNEYKKNWMVEFYRGNSQSVTGEGDAQRIFATVLHAIGQFIKKKKPASLFFSAVKEDDPTGSRTKLYDRLVQRYASNLGYNLQKQESPGSMSYKLTRMENVKEDLELPNYLYHATYRPLLKSIKKSGLGGSGAQAKWEDSKPGVTYLAIDPDVAVSYAESSDVIPEEWLDKIVVLRIPANKLDKSKLHIDRNVQDNEGDTLEYHGIIPFAMVQLNEASGYIPSEKEKNDWRFKTALTVDVKPDTIKKNAKAFGFKVSRAGIPPLLKK